MPDDTTRAPALQAPASPENRGDAGVGSSGVMSSRADAHSLSPSDSPCVAVCSTLYDDICRGCGRTALEVANWVIFDDAEKRQIWDRITAQGYPRRNR